MAGITGGPTKLDWLGVMAGDKNEETFRFNADGVPWNLTGAVVSAQARLTSTDPDAALTAVVTTINESIGHYRVGWDGDEVRDLLGTDAVWNGVWDLQVLEAGQDLARTLVRGVFRAEMDVTRAL